MKGLALFSARPGTVPREKTVERHTMLSRALVEDLDRAPLAGVRARHVPHHDAEIGPTSELADGLHVDSLAG